MKTPDERIHSFCLSVKKGFGSIPDTAVKREFERLSEGAVDASVLGKLLAILEKNDLLDKKASVNKDPNFYRRMYKTLSKK